MWSGTVRNQRQPGAHAPDVDRLLRLLALLTTRPWWSAAELAAALDVTERTVRREAGADHSRPPRSQAQALDHATVTLPHSPATTVAPEQLVTLAQACRTPEQVRVDYRSRDGVRSRRLVEPYRLVHAGWRRYLVGRDVDRDGWRTLRVDRIARLVATGRRFTRDDEPDAAATVYRAVSTSPYRWTARVRLHAPVHAVADRVPATVAVPEADGPTTVLTTGADAGRPCELPCPHEPLGVPFARLLSPPGHAHGRRPGVLAMWTSRHLT